MLKIKLKDIGVFYNGLKGKNLSDFSDNYPDKYIDFKSILNGNINVSELPCVKINDGEQQNVVKRNDLLINMTSENIDDIGLCNIYCCDEKVYLNSFSQGFRVCDNYDPHYISYLLKSPNYRRKIKKQSQGITRINLAPSRLGNIDLQIHNYDNQKKMGSFFKELDELIELYSNKIEKMNTSFMFIKKNIIKKCNDRFENVSLKDIATFINGKAHEKLVSENGSIKLINSKFIATNASVAKKVTKNICPTERGDICIVMSDVPNGKALAKCYIAHGDEAVNQRVCIIRSDKFLPEVLMLLLNRNKKYLMFDDHVSQTNLKKEDILNVNLPFIPLNIQSEIKQVLNEFDELLKEYNDLVNNYKCIKKYYLNKIFN